MNIRKEIDDGLNMNQGLYLLPGADGELHDHDPDLYIFYIFLFLGEKLGVIGEPFFPPCRGVPRARWGFL